MSARQQLVDDLIRDEGLRLRLYSDTVGKVTIGVGHNITDNGISGRVAMVILDEDIDAAVTDLAGSFPWYLELDEVRQRAVTNFRFNLGPSRFRLFKRFIAAMAEQDYVKAAASLRQSLWNGQVGQRAPRIIHMVLTGQDA